MPRTSIYFPKTTAILFPDDVVQNYFKHVDKSPISTCRHAVKTSKIKQEKLGKNMYLTSVMEFNSNHRRYIFKTLDNFRIQAAPLKRNWEKCFANIEQYI